MQIISFEQAVAALSSLAILIYPTETFFAIGGSAVNSHAVDLVYSAKGRSKNAPLPVIIGDLGQLDMLTGTISPEAEKLVGAFWPGPLTVIFPARADLPPLLTAGTGRVAVRLSSHAEASRLARTAGFPLVSSSANSSGLPPVTRQDDLEPELVLAAHGAVYAGGTAPAGGAPSTVVEIYGNGREGKALRILREGGIPASRLNQLGFAVAGL